ncbi:hypothetical protein BLA29_005394, partial [Euroglyphus maynei]
MTVKLDKLFYFRLIRTCPVISILTILSICFSLFAFIVYRDALPMFDDPIIGFEARNTELSNRINTWRLLIESTSWNGALSLYPKSSSSSNNNNDSVDDDNIRRTTNVQRIKSNKNKNNRNKLKNRKNKMKKSNQSLPTNPFESKNHFSNQFFCGKIVGDYVQIVIETNDGSNLLDIKSIRNLCQLDQRILRMENHDRKLLLNNSTIFTEFCESKNFDKCCPSWSLTNFLMIFANKTNCDQLNEEDVRKFIKHLDSCSPFYAGHYLNEDCSVEEPCPNTPPECFQHENLVFNVFHYLVDYRFMNMDKKILNHLVETSTDSIPFLTSTSIILPIAKSSKLMPYYENITNSLQQFSRSNENNPFSTLNLIQWFRPSSTSKSNHLSFDNVAVIAADMGLKYTLFNKSLISDLMLPSLA